MIDNYITNEKERFEKMLENISKRCEFTSVLEQFLDFLGNYKENLLMIEVSPQDFTIQQSYNGIKLTVNLNLKTKEFIPIFKIQ